MIRQGFSERSLKKVLNDASYRVTVDVDNAGEYVLERVEHTFTNHLVRDNHWVAFMFTGKYPDRDTLPHFLLRENYEAVRAAKTEIRIVTDDVVEYPQQVPDQAFDKVSLSDVTSCIDREQFAMLMKQVARISRPGGLTSNDLQDPMVQAQMDAYPPHVRADSLPTHTWMSHPHLFTSTLHSWPYLIGLLFSLAISPDSSHAIDPARALDSLLTGPGLGDPASLRTKYGIDPLNTDFWDAGLQTLSNRIAALASTITAAG